jgi:hypothetical protein
MDGLHPLVFYLVKATAMVGRLDHDWIKKYFGVHHMSCWVVPSVAAELWGVSVSQILDRAGRGEIPSRQELGFTMVDIAPDTPALQIAKKRFGPPKTYTHVPESAGPRLAEDHSEEKDTFSTDWRQIRMQVSLLRRRPAAA